MNALDIIKAAIGSGEAFAKSSKELQALTGLSERELRKSIEALRRQGVPILSSSRGYYKPASLNELDRFIVKEGKRAKSILYTLQQIKELRRQLMLKNEFGLNYTLDE